MGTRFDPADWLARVLPKNFEKSGLLSDNLSIKQKYLKALVRATSLSGKEITEEVYKMVDFYEKKEAELKAAGVRAYKQEALNGQALLKQRIKNMLVYTEVQEQRKAHKGQWYRWLPSNATTPDPEHALLYGKIFREGTGDKQGNMPGERYGCQCGIEWLDENEETPEIKVVKHTNENLVNAVHNLYENAMVGKGLKDSSLDVNMGKIKGKSAYKIKRFTGIDVKKFKHILKGENLKHGINRHAKDVAVPITADRVAMIPHIVKHFDSVKLEKRKDGNLRLKFTKRIENTYVYVATVSKSKKQLLFKTFFGNK